MYVLRPTCYRGSARPDGGSPFGPTQGGFTLIEALITLLVVSIGLLGVAALQVVGLQGGAGAFRHSQATWLTYDMADRMRANIDPAALDRDDTSVGPDAIADHYNGISLNATSTPNGQACGSGDDCTRAQMVLFDTDQWLDGINDLPNGTATVDEDLAVGGRYRIRVMWDEVNAGSQDIDAEVGCPTVNPADPVVTQTCVELWVQP
jgi:type IV pilus assembly protein PilV